MGPQDNILNDRHIAKEVCQLEAPYHAQLSYSIWLKAAYLFPHKNDFPTGRTKGTGDHIKNSCLARTVGADQSYDFTLIDAEVQPVDSQKTAKLLRQIFTFKKNRSQSILAPSLIAYRTMGR